MLKSSSLCLYSSNLGTFWLKIEQFWPFEEISMFSNGGLGYRTALTDTILKGDHLRIISAKFGWDLLSSFRGEDFFLISSALFLFLAWRPSWLELGITGHNFGRGHPRIIPQKFGCNGPVVSEEKIFFLISSPLFSYLHNRSKWVMGFTSKLQDR